MLPWLTIAILATAAVAIRALPRSFVRAYCASFIRRHGVSVQLGLVVLATVVCSMVFATLVLPQKRPVMELMDVAVVALALLSASVDFYVFSRTRAARE